MKRHIFPLLTLGTLALATPTAHSDEVLDQARAITRKYLLVDTHIDVPYRLHEHWEDVTHATAQGEFDLPRAQAGGLNVPFMSIYTPPESELDGSAYRLANILIDQVEAIVARAPDSFAIATSPDEVETQFQKGRIALALGMENGAPIAGDLDKLRHFHGRGVRYVTLAHGLANHISDSSYDDIRLWQGLSPFGVEVVKTMNELGMMVDISHLSDAAAAQVIRISAVPVIASHSSMRAFTPDFERNLSDELLKALAGRGGVVMINFGSGFITKAANAYSSAYKKSAGAYAERYQVSGDSPQMKAFEADYRRRQPYPFATVGEVAEHIDHAVKVAGIDHVGLGSDFDGVGNSLPVGLKDVSAYPNLVAELLRRGYGEEDLRKLLGANLMRVWRAVAAGSSAGTRTGTALSPAG
ncbi:MAG: dipeptidase [Parahaliea sp.]